MKECPKCKAVMEDDALFCGICGTKLGADDAQVEETAVSEEKYCVHCGKAIEIDSAFCPFCGKPQDVEEEQKEEPQQEHSEQPKQPEQPEESKEPKEPEVEKQPTDEGKEKKSGSKKWLLFLFLIVLLVGGAGMWYYLSDRFSYVGNNEMIEALDTDSIAIDDDSSGGNVKVDFIESMYKDFFENENFDAEDISNLHKYLSPSVAKALKKECPYEGGGGDSLYIVDFFRDGSLSYERPDYGDKVVSRTIEPEDNDWFLVTNIWDVIKEPVRVHLQVKSVDGELKIVDIKGVDNSAVDSEDSGLISFENALKVVEEIVIMDNVFKGFRSPDNVKNIMAEYGYKYAGKYHVDREFLFDVLYYKNCILGQSIGDGCYSNVPQAGGSGTSSFIGIDGNQLFVVPFNKAAFDVFLNQAKEFGATVQEEDESTITYKFSSFRITGFKTGVISIKYCILITKEESK